MPGLTAILHLHRRKRVDLHLFERMSASLKHRDWYGVDTYVSDDGHAAVSRVHLRTIHPETQPHVTGNGALKVFLHGEIYDDETNEAAALDFVARAYERHGPGFAAHLNGSFAIVIVDEARQRVVIATDRTASRPLFHFRAEDTLVVSSEVKALLLAPGLRPTLDLSAIGSFLSCGHPLDGHTFFEDIRRLGPATVMTLSRTGIDVQRYWHHTFDETARDLGADHYQRTLADLIRLAVKRRLRTSHEYGVLLSGGYDSRGILGCVLENRPAAETQTISWGQREDLAYGDCWVAGRLARRLGVRHSFYELEPDRLPAHAADFVHLSDGLTDGCTNYPESLRVFQRIREDLGVQILLRGDECFGYTSRWGLRSLVDVPSARPLLRRSAYELLADVSADMVRDVSGRCALADPQNRRDVFYLEQRLTQRLHPWTQVKAVELEVRTPYLDNDILDFLATLPAHYRLDRALYRRTVVSEFPGLYDEFALRSNEIDWQTEIARSEDLRRYLLRVLGGSQLVSSLVDPAALQRALATMPQKPQRLKTLVVAALGRTPALYDTLKGTCAGLARRSRGAGSGRKDVLLFRLLTLALWERAFAPPESALSRSLEHAGRAETAGIA